jgi:hypothetical protein
LDQLEGRHCKDTQKCWPFCIGAPKGPFLQGLMFTLFFGIFFSADP